MNTVTLDWFDVLKKPREIEGFTKRQIGDISNGCGPKGWGWLIPDRFRLIGLDFTPACDIHDVCYHIGIPKKEADNIFLDNLTIIARKSHTGPLGEWLAMMYYLAVKNGGKGAYNKRNEKP